MLQKYTYFFNCNKKMKNNLNSCTNPTEQRLNEGQRSRLATLQEECGFESFVGFVTKTIVSNK